VEGIAQEGIVRESILIRPEVSTSEGHEVAFYQPLLAFDSSALLLVLHTSSVFDNDPQIGLAGTIWVDHHRA
jgi:hypothetical protein